MRSAYVRSLIASAEAERAKRQAAKDEEARVEARERLVPLDIRLQRLLATIPDDVKAEGLSLPVLQTQLRARGRGHSRCHVGELGDALRALGWVRERRWRGNVGGFRALWYPGAALNRKMV